MTSYPLSVPWAGFIPTTSGGGSRADGVSGGSVTATRYTRACCTASYRRRATRSPITQIWRAEPLERELVCEKPPRESSSTSSRSAHQLPVRDVADQRGEFLTIGDVDLDTRSVQMTFYRAHRHRQPVGDIPVAQARCHKVGDFPLASRQRQRVIRQIQCGRADSTAYRRQPVGRRGGFHAAAAVVGILERDRGLGSGV